MAVTIIKRDPNFNPEIHKKTDIKPSSIIPAPVPPPKPLLFIEDTIAPDQDQNLRDKRNENVRAAIETLHVENNDGQPIEKKVKLPFSYDSMAQATEEDDLEKEILNYKKPRKSPSSSLESLKQAQASIEILQIEPKPLKNNQSSKIKKSSSSTSTSQVKIGPKPILEIPNSFDDDHEELLEEFLDEMVVKKKKENQIAHFNPRNSDSSIDRGVFQGLHDQRTLGHEMSHLSMDEVSLNMQQKKNVQEMIDYYQGKINEHMKTSNRLDWAGKFLSFVSLFTGIALLASVVATGGVSAIFMAFTAAVGLASGVITVGNSVVKLHTQNLIGKSTVMQALRDLQSEKIHDFLKACYALNNRMHHYWEMNIQISERRSKAQKLMIDL